MRQGDVGLESRVPVQGHSLLASGPGAHFLACRVGVLRPAFWHPEPRPAPCRSPECVVLDRALGAGVLTLAGSSSSAPAPGAGRSGPSVARLPPTLAPWTASPGSSPPSRTRIHPAVPSCVPSLHVMPQRQGRAGAHPVPSGVAARDRSAQTRGFRRQTDPLTVQEPESSRHQQGRAPSKGPRGAPPTSGSPRAAPLWSLPPSSVLTQPPSLGVSDLPWILPKAPGLTVQTHWGPTFNPPKYLRTSRARWDHWANPAGSPRPPAGFLVATPWAGPSGCTAGESGGRRRSAGGSGPKPVLPPGGHAEDRPASGGPACCPPRAAEALSRMASLVRFPAGRMEGSSTRPL